MTTASLTSERREGAKAAVRAAMWPAPKPDSRVKSLLAHPGWSATNLQSTGPTGIMRALLSVGNRVLAQDAEQGALPTLYAATAADAEGGDYYGPDGFAEMRGRPTKVKVIAEDRDPDVGRRLWAVSEELTGVRYGLSGAAVA